MKKLFILIAAVLVGTYCFAGVQNSTLIKSLSSAWTSQSSIQPKQDKNDILMGYAGQDISRKPTIVSRTVTV